MCQKRPPHSLFSLAPGRVPPPSPSVKTTQGNCMGRDRAGPRPPMALARCCLVPATPQREESPSFPSSLSEEEPFPFATADRGTGQQTTGGKKEGFLLHPLPSSLSERSLLSRRCGGEGKVPFMWERVEATAAGAPLHCLDFFLFLSPSELSWERLRLRCLRLLLRLRIDVAPDSERGEEEAAAKRRGFNNSATFVRRPPLPHPSSPSRTFASYRPTQVSNSVGEGRGRENGRGPRLSPRPKASPSCNKGRWGEGGRGYQAVAAPHRTQAAAGLPHDKVFTSREKTCHKKHSEQVTEDLDGRV